MSTNKFFADQVRNAFQASIETKQAFIESDCPLVVVDMAKTIAHAIANGNKLMLCGNGGSAADAQHLAAELLIRLRPTHNRVALPAITLATDTSMLTACGNDFSFDDIFSRPLAALARPGDVLLGITTSGMSPNVIKALKMARKMDVVTMGFLGSEGGSAANLCDHALLVPSKKTGHIQEAHITAGHILFALVEDILVKESVIELGVTGNN